MEITTKTTYLFNFEIDGLKFNFEIAASSMIDAADNLRQKLIAMAKKCDGVIAGTHSNQPK